MMQQTEIKKKYQGLHKDDVGILRRRVEEHIRKDPSFREEIILNAVYTNIIKHEDVISIN